MKICIIFGTRPEIIKISAVIKECIHTKINFVLIHTNQHYTKNLDEIFFKCLKLPKPKHNLKIGSGKHGEVTGKMIISIEEKLIEEKPNIVLVQGDTNSVLAGAIAASKLNIPIGHIEAGLRSFDHTMPEETNRIIVDHISDYLFVPTLEAKKNLLKEGLSKKKIILTGNTVVDALLGHIKIASQSKILKKLNLSEKKYILATIHRQENVDNKIRLLNIIKGLQQVSKIHNLQVIIPGHPRFIKMLEKFNISVNKEVITIIEPLDYLDFIHLEKKARVIITDSGGVQEEACILGTPCVTVRDNTERPETLFVRSNILSGTSTKGIKMATKKMLATKRVWKNPFGDGHSSEKILSVILN